MIKAFVIYKQKKCAFFSIALGKVFDNHPFLITVGVPSFSLKLGRKKNSIIVQKVKPGLQIQSYIKRPTEYTYTFSGKSLLIY